MAKIDLGALDFVQTALAGNANPAGEQDGKAREFPLDVIDEDPDQPRKEFEPTKLEELAASIKESGVLQPITIKPHPELPGRYVIRYGARRYRASRIAGKTTIPAFISHEGDEYAQVIENEQRDNLTALELAAFIQKRLSAGDSKTEIARRLGKPNSYITNHLSLIDMPPAIQAAWDEGKTRNPQRVYELRNLHKKHPEAVEAWCEGQAEIGRQSITLLADELAGTANAAKSEQEALGSHPAPNADSPSTESAESGEMAAECVTGPKPKAETIPFRRTEGVKRLTLDVPLMFVELVEARELTPEQVLAAFMADLSHTADSNGSDERRMAEDWFDRVLWPESADQAAVG